MGAAIATPVSEPIHELNTTPLIDVMLVLLIMFIITIPIQTHAVDIDLPAEGPPPPVPRPDRNKVAIEPDGTILWNGAPIAMSQLRAVLTQTARMPRPPELHVEPHAEARYEVVDEVLGVIRRADVPSMGLVGNERYTTF
jgi:biopolymer transport protein ExbD